MATNESRKIGVFLRKKKLFVALPLRNRLKYKNGDGQLRSALNEATSCANTVMIGGVTPRNVCYFLYLCEKIAYPAYYLRTCSTNLDHIGLFSFDRHVGGGD